VVSKVKARVALVAALLALVLAPAVYGSPIEIEVDSSAPARGRYLEYGVTVRSTKRLYAKIYAAVYVPGQGWSGWEELWKGELNMYKYVTGRHYIPEDAGNGSVVIFVSVHYVGRDDYEYHDGQRYYIVDSMVYVVGALPNTAAEEWADRYRGLEANYTMLKEKCDSEHEEMLKLSAKYSDLQERYRGLLENNSLLQQRVDELKSTVAALRQDLVAKNNMVFALIAATATLAAVATIMALEAASLRRRLPQA